MQETKVISVLQEGLKESQIERKKAEKEKHIIFLQHAETLSKFAAKMRIFSMEKKDKKQDEKCNIC